MNPFSQSRIRHCNHSIYLSTTAAGSHHHLLLTSSDV